jgi:hypothetical protein
VLLEDALAAEQTHANLEDLAPSTDSILCSTHDEHYNEGGLVKVRDAATGVEIMYAAALADFETLEGELLRVGTHFIHREEEKKSDVAVDRWAVLLQLYEQEADFLANKLKLFDCYLECYSHCMEARPSAALAQRMVDLMALRPRLDLDGSLASMAHAYRGESSVLHKQWDLVRDVIETQRFEETYCGAFSSEWTEVTQEADDRAATKFYLTANSGLAPTGTFEFYPSLKCLPSILDLCDAYFEKVCRIACTTINHLDNLNDSDSTTPPLPAPHTCTHTHTSKAKLLRAMPEGAAASKLISLHSHVLAACKDVFGRCKVRAAPFPDVESGYSATILGLEESYALNDPFVAIMTLKRAENEAKEEVLPHPPPLHAPLSSVAFLTIPPLISLTPSLLLSHPPSRSVYTCH